MHQAIARWTIEYDLQLTQRCYAQLPAGTGCTCAYCRNFEALPANVFPQEFIALLDSLAIDVKKPSEVCNYCKEPSGLYLMGGWYHFVGTIVSGVDAWQPRGSGFTFDGEELAKDMKIGFSSRLAIVRDEFKGQPLVQLEFQIAVPWALPEQQPE